VGNRCDESRAIITDISLAYGDTYSTACMTDTTPSFLPVKHFLSNTQAKEDGKSERWSETNAAVNGGLEKDIKHDMTRDDMTCITFIIFPSYAIQERSETKAINSLSRKEMAGPQNR
jgi:hypothetical protein